MLWSLSLLAAGAAAKILYAGVNESGGEFGTWSNDAIPTTGLPGRFGVDYAFINKSTVDIFVEKDKINTFRVAFLLYFGYFKEAIDYITITKGAYAILDPHNYMRYNNPSQQPTTGSIIGDSSDIKAATTAQFQAFWNQLANRFKSNEKVIQTKFGIMNEPHDMPTSLVFANNQAAINGIRATGAKQLILAPGNDWTGGHSWTGHVNASSEYMYKLNDPAKNLAIEVHEYLDSDYSGTHAECTQPGPSNLAALTAWLKKYGLKAIVGETGGARTPTAMHRLKKCSTILLPMTNTLAGQDGLPDHSGAPSGPAVEMILAILSRAPKLVMDQFLDNLGQWIPAKHPEDTKAQWDLELELRGRWTAALHATGDRRNPIPLRPEALTRFHSRTPPGISIQDYLKRIVKYTNVERSCLLITLHYIDQICTLLPHFTISSLTVHRFVISSITVSSKALCDAFCTNSHYARVGGIKLIELNVLEREFLEKIDWRLTWPRDQVSMGEALAKNVRQDPVTLESYQANGNGPDKTTPSPPRSPATSTAPSSVHQVPCANAPPPPISTKPFAQPQPRDTVASPSRTIIAGVTSPSLRRAGRSPVTGPSRSIPSSPSLKRARDGTEDIMPSLTNAHLRKMEESSPRTRRRTGTNSS
ncbi:Cellulase (glycosyl hydrolase family 5 protein) [Rhizoctonia solani]|uniref:cellulase n=1 Tax=Rhizoctonia solani TaxID=456999 RepID=A0A8H8P5V6_9AGAM|nr:Cellulase (glycosyl hydrolase family 5 protein) [Rhizoctonia solani]QRW24137.1 Cellulase (glycosyl hydrolase family 5 protein) [Rhizoctonia solani]